MKSRLAHLMGRTFSACTRLLMRVSSATEVTEWCTDRPTLTMLGLYESPRLHQANSMSSSSHSCTA